MFAPIRTYARDLASTRQCNKTTAAKKKRKKRGEIIQIEQKRTKPMKENDSTSNKQNEPQGQEQLTTYYIGIDPDVDKNGVALLDVKTRRLSIQTLPFAETLDYITKAHYELHQKLKNGFKVVIEAGWMNHGNYHVKPWEGSQVSAAKGVSQGRNEQTSRLLGEMCKHYGIPFEFQRPLFKSWQGKDKKITQVELEDITGQKLVRTNQEGRDAALLAWHKAHLPMRLSESCMAKVTAKKTQNSRSELERLLKMHSK